MRCPPKSELMRACYEQAVATVDENNEEWLKPVEILNEHVLRCGLEQFIRPGICNPDWWPRIEELVRMSQDVPESWYVIHWCNESMRLKGGLDRNDLPRNGMLGRLLDQHGLGRLEREGDRRRFPLSPRLTDVVPRLEPRPGVAAVKLASGE